jgi:uncharacterized membrane protein YhfC
VWPGSEASRDLGPSARPMCAALSTHTLPVMPISVGAWVALLAQVAAFYLFPPVLWAATTRLLRVPWRWVGVGVLSWLSALPALLLVPLFVVGMLEPHDPRMRQVAWGAALSVTAGLVEETSRWFWFRRHAVVDPHDRRYALVAGAGHGGVEAMFLGLQFAVAPLAMALASPGGIVGYTNEGIVGWALLGGASRILLVFGHMALSLVVWRSVASGRAALLAIAVVIHVTLDLMAFVFPVFAPALWWLVAVPVLMLAAWAVSALAAEATAVRAAHR